MQKTNIEWVINSDGSPGFTSNPLRGKCGHFGTPICGDYCYAERIRQRFKQPAELSWHPEELQQIERRAKPATIFMGSMYDIFGEWVHKDYIYWILDTAKHSPQHTFLFLTKNPARYVEFEFSPNCWIGYSNDGKERAMYTCHVTCHANTFVSFEPLIGRHVLLWPGTKAVIIGAQTGAGAVKPDRDIVDGIISAAGDRPVFLKNNLLSLFPDIPKRQETAWGKK